MTRVGRLPHRGRASRTPRCPAGRCPVGRCPLRGALVRRWQPAGSVGLRSVSGWPVSGWPVSGWPVTRPAVQELRGLGSGDLPGHRAGDLGRRGVDGIERFGGHGLDGFHGFCRLGLDGFDRPDGFEGFGRPGLEADDGARLQGVDGLDGLDRLGFGCLGFGCLASDPLASTGSASAVLAGAVMACGRLSWTVTSCLPRVSAAQSRAVRDWAARYRAAVPGCAGASWRAAFRSARLSLMIASDSGRIPVGWVAPSGPMAPAVAPPGRPAAAMLAPAAPPSAPEPVSGSGPLSAAAWCRCRTSPQRRPSRPGLALGLGWLPGRAGTGLAAGPAWSGLVSARSRARRLAPASARSRRPGSSAPAWRQPASARCRLVLPPRPGRPGPASAVRPASASDAASASGRPGASAPLGFRRRRRLPAPPPPRRRPPARLRPGPRPGRWRFPGLRFRDGRLTRLRRDGDRLQEPRQALRGRLLHGRAVVQPDRQDDRLGVGEDVGPLVTGRPEHGTARPLPRGCCGIAVIARVPDVRGAAWPAATYLGRLVFLGALHLACAS